MNCAYVLLRYTKQSHIKYYSRYAIDLLWCVISILTRRAGILSLTIVLSTSTRHFLLQFSQVQFTAEIQKDSHPASQPLVRTQGVNNFKYLIRTP